MVSAFTAAQAGGLKYLGQTSTQSDACLIRVTSKSLSPNEILLSFDYVEIGNLSQ